MVRLARKDFHWYRQPFLIWVGQLDAMAVSQAPRVLRVWPRGTSIAWRKGTSDFTLGQRPCTRQKKMDEGAVLTYICMHACMHACTSSGVSPLRTQMEHSEGETIWCFRSSRSGRAESISGGADLRCLRAASASGSADCSCDAARLMARAAGPESARGTTSSRRSCCHSVWPCCQPGGCGPGSWPVPGSRCVILGEGSQLRTASRCSSALVCCESATLLTWMLRARAANCSSMRLAKAFMSASTDGGSAHIALDGASLSWLSSGHAVETTVCRLSSACAGPQGYACPQEASGLAETSVAMSSANLVTLAETESPWILCIMR
mmetsp:Transcript_29655/g.88073  ORF Transcript_29655/g.88073 Transcript_29655/m.88073 type:complete len:321 (+) Transcript_29655:23-985(+)